MAAEVYRLKISYKGLDEKIWREVEISSNYVLDMLGYLTLATFGARAEHLFRFVINGISYDIPDEDCLYPLKDMKEYKMFRLGLNVGDKFEMEYDFGVSHIFSFEMLDITPMEKHKGGKYPQLLDGAGKSIIENISVEELSMLVSQIDKNGKTDEPVYYDPDGISVLMWDYRRFELKYEKMLLRGNIDHVYCAYLPFWGYECVYE